MDIIRGVTNVSILKRAASEPRRPFSVSSHYQMGVNYLFKKRQSLMAPIQDEIYNAVRDISDQKGYQLILDRASGGSIIYASPKIDISDEVLQKLGSSN